VTVEAQWAGAAHAADALQASYFRRFLADERKQVADDLLHSRAQLRDCLEADQVVGLRTLARARSQVRELETKQSELNRLIAALDRRFSALWSRRG
jgi:hypothetical protein